MAFNAEKFNTLGGQRKAGVSFGTFGYLSSDTKATVLTAGYFNSLRGLLKVNDMIQVLDKSASPSTQYLICVTAVPAANTYTDVTAVEVSIPSSSRPVTGVDIDADYVVREEDDVILAENTITVTLLAVTAAVRKPLTIINVGDDEITIVGDINGASSYTLEAKYEGVTIYPSSAEWVIINKH
jgi:hypothetical protein